MVKCFFLDKILTSSIWLSYDSAFSLHKVAKFKQVKPTSREEAGISENKCVLTEHRLNIDDSQISTW